MAAVTISLVVTILVSAFFILLRCILKRHRSHQVLKRYGIPGPKPNFLDGHMSQMRKNATPHDLMDSWLNQYGNVFGYYMGEVPYIVVNDLDMLKEILIKDFSSFMNRPKLYMNIEPFAHTMMGLDDQRWKEVRSIISPTFSTSKLKGLKFIFDKKVDTTVKVVRQKAENNEMFNIYETMQALTLDVIADSALAMKTRCQEDPNDSLLLALRGFMLLAHSKGVELGVMFPFLEKVFTFVINNLGHFSHLNDLILGNLKKVIEMRRNDPKLRSMDILQLMLDHSEDGAGSKNKLSEKEVMANAYVTLMAGYETTSTVLGFTFYLLIKHPDIQERLFEEIDKAPDSSYDTINELQYLGQVLDESMRIYNPVTGFISREVKFDKVIGSYTLPKGSVVMVPAWQLHHNPDLFPDPWKFDPERFSPQNKKSIKSMSYIPFGDGPRNCIGSRFALLEAKLALFKLIKNFKFEPCEKTEKTMTLMTPTLITNPANGVWLRAISRN